MKHILIPTDFRIQSLNTVHAAIATHGNEHEKIKIILFHLLRMPTDIPDLLFRSMRNKHTDIVPGEFRESCEILENRYARAVAGINIKFGFGSTVAYLKNLLEAEKVDLIFTCPDVHLLLPSPRSVEMAALLKKTGYPIQSVSYNDIKGAFADVSSMAISQGIEMKIPKTEGSYAAEK